MIYEYLVIAGYFLLVLGIGLSFRKMAKRSTSDYFRGGGRMLWWMVGVNGLHDAVFRLDLYGGGGQGLLRWVCSLPRISCQYVFLLLRLGILCAALSPVARGHAYRSDQASIRSSE